MCVSVCVCSFLNAMVNHNLTQWGWVTHTCVTHPGSLLAHIKACRLLGAKQLTETTVGFCELNPENQNLCEIWLKLHLQWVSFNMSCAKCRVFHYNAVVMSAMASQITAASIVYSTICSGADQRKHQSSVSLAFVRGIHQWPVDSTHKGSVTRKMFPLDDIIMWIQPHFHTSVKIANPIEWDTDCTLT